MNWKRRITVSAVATCLLAGGTAWAHGGEQSGQPAMTGEDQAMMEAWLKAATPNDHHAWLMASAGTWHVKQTMWMDPGAEPTSATGKAERRALLGGRVIEESFSSTFMGQPFQGLGHTGYDNVSGKFWATWMDSMSTALFTGTGECSEDHSACTFTISGTDPMTGKTLTMRAEAEYADGREVHELYETRDGEEFRSMKMIYTRTGNE